MIPQIGTAPPFPEVRSRGPISTGAPPLARDSFQLSEQSATQSLSLTRFPQETPSGGALASSGVWQRSHFVIFGKNGPAIPTEIADLVKKPAIQLGGIPSGRWTVTPEIESYHRSEVVTQPESELRDSPDSELTQLLKPLLQRRYGQKNNLNVVELGPSTSTTVAETLNSPGTRYVAVDASEPLLEKQIELLSDPTAARHFHVKGDTYNLPLVAGSADLIFTSCHPPFFSASISDKLSALDQVRQALKPGGEFILFPYDADTQPAEVNAYIERNFKLEEKVLSPQGEKRFALVLSKMSDNDT